MTDQRLGLRVAAVIFGLIAVVHVIRFAANIELRIGARMIPMWPTAIAAIVGATLCIWLWRLSGRGQPK